MDSDMKELRTSLLVAIKSDQNMFTKAKIDPMFDAVRPEVDALLEDIFQRTKANAEKEIADAEFAVHRMKKWFDGRYASSDDEEKYESIPNKISDAKDKIKTQSYFGYDDALGIMSEANVLVAEIQASIIPHAKSSNYLNNISNNILNLNKKIKQGYIIRISVSLVLLFILISSIKSENPLTFLTSLYLICFLNIRSEGGDFGESLLAAFVVVVGIIIGGIILSIITIIITTSIFSEDEYKWWAVFKFLIGFLFSVGFILLSFEPNEAIRSEISHLEWLKQKIAAAKESLL